MIRAQSEMEQDAGKPDVAGACHASALGLSKVLIVVACVACVLNLGYVWKLGLGRPMESDAWYYLAIAKNVAAGKGYCLTEGSYWPGIPTMSRAPGWPLVLAALLKLVPFADPDILMRSVNVLLNVLAAVLSAGLAWFVFRKARGALFAGLLYAAHPAALSFAYEGGCEILFAVLILCGVLLSVRGFGLRRVALAGLCLGYATLVRANLLLWFPLAGVGILIWMWRGNRWGVRGVWACLALGALLFVLPSAIWVFRNKVVSGAFPVLSTIRGQTFYGGNNSVVATDLKWWGYWVFPDQIPGEVRMAELAKTMSEYEVDCYYFSKGTAFVRAQWFAMPRLLLGKLVRAYVPVPWRPGWASYVASAYRWLLFVLAIVGLVVAWNRVGLAYGVQVWALVAMNVLTVLIFWGCARFAFEIEPLFLPFCGVTLERAWGVLWGSRLVERN